MSKVSLVECKNYDMDYVSKGIDETFNNLGGINKFINPGDKVFLKLNLVMKKNPEDAATTHPAIVEAVAKKLIGAGAKVIIGDSPGGPYNKVILQSLYRACGIEAAAKQSGAELNYDCSSEEYNHSEAVAVKRLTLIKPMMDCDKIITLSKLKTHGMVLYTGAVKVMFGAIPGVLKAEYHYKMPDIKNFSNMLVDICTLTKPVLSIIDGIYGMEGEGPTAGAPIHSGILIASENPYEADVSGAYLIGVNPLDVPTIQRCRERNIVSGNIKDIEVIGVNLDDMRKRYKVPDIRTVNFSGKIPKPLERLMSRHVLPRPVFSQEVCIGCSNCKQSCPPGAITMENGRPRVDLYKCIRCFCCQELCPHKAIEIKRPWILRKLVK
ncbi:NADH-quinone oxidoreductase subunit I [Oxobacter pfennigii]|uniref:Ferredoxin n=1 Tax=Oxobacter pfennigii TaxID=36849 RepID=A0A0P8WBG2_9CLOT|nr:DUF362 domain-containing protein [Oxobacter pfennigii]KPU45269.1 NADH-quinone oxidoreductase subunit I [Oxobacter pfennigii]